MGLACLHDKQGNGDDNSVRAKQQHAGGTLPRSATGRPAWQQPDQLTKSLCVPQLHSLQQVDLQLARLPRHAACTCKGVSSGGGVSGSGGGSAGLRRSAGRLAAVM